LAQRQSVTTHDPGDVEVIARFGRRNEGRRQGAAGSGALAGARMIARYAAATPTKAKGEMATVDSISGSGADSWCRDCGGTVVIHPIW
jgi:hypothetical protein